MDAVYELIEERVLFFTIRYVARSIECTLLQSDYCRVGRGRCDRSVRYQVLSLTSDELFLMFKQCTTQTEARSALSLCCTRNVSDSA